MSNGENHEAISLADQVTALKQQVAQYQRLAALGELLSTVAHDLNNILMPVINYAQMGLRNRDDATRERAFSKILAAGQRAAKLSTGVLSMARGRPTTVLEPTDISRVISDTLVLVERELTHHHVQVDQQIDEVPEALACGPQIQQVLLNLLINARQAMPQGGRVIIRLAHDAAAGTIDLVIRDTGTGIEPEKLRRIFDPFFTTKSGPDATGKGGTGLGLASCKEIIEAHKGRIRVESSIGVGTAFTIKLPMVAEQTAPPIVPQSPVNQPGPQTPR